MSVQSEIDRINGAKSTLAANIDSAGFTAVEGASIVQLASTVGDAFTDTSSRLATVNGASGTISTQLDTLDSTKAAIKDAIVAKGVEVPEGTTFYEYAGLIGGIETSTPIETCIVTNNSTVNVYCSCLINEKISVRKLRLESGEVIVGSIAIYDDVAMSASVSGDIENMGIVDYGNGFGDCQAFVINGDCTFNTQGGGGN